jgi:oligoribonuclease NrnB/cAMP/cGMP phosphodiesterase (DHH superfamily)
MFAKRLPRLPFFLPRFLKIARFKRRIERAAREAPKVVHITHFQCLDGAGSDVLMRLAHGDSNVRTVYVRPEDVRRALMLIPPIAGNGRIIAISDLSVQMGDGDAVAGLLASLKRRGWRVEWRDHHHKQWEGGAMEKIKTAVDVLNVDAESAECGASLVQADLLPNDAFAKDFANVMRDRDLFLRKDERSSVLNEAMQEMGGLRYVAHVVKNRKVVDGTIQAAFERRRREKDEERRLALKRSRVHALDGATVAITYGRLDATEVLAALRESHGTDIECLVKPDGSFSIRSRKGLEISHLVAQRLSGGGHPNASGGQLGLAGPMLWLGPGFPKAENLLLDAIRAVLTKA